jgi:hypothetical protein
MRQPIVDRYQKPYTIHEELKHQIKLHPIHWKKNAENSLVVPGQLLKNFSKELLGVEESKLNLEFAQTLLDQSMMFN